MCVCLTFLPTVALADDLSSSPIILLDNGETSGNQVEIIATLAKNSGITSMTLNLTFDDSALSLVEVSSGSALSDLSCVRSGSYNTKPYKINYMWRSYFENDYSTGVLLTFVFEIKDTTRDGTYEVALSAEKKGVEYADNDVAKYKNLVSDTAKITVRGEETFVEIIPGPVEDLPPENDFTILEIMIPVSVVVIALVLFAVILTLKKGKNVKK